MTMRKLAWIMFVLSILNIFFMIVNGNISGFLGWVACTIWVTLYIYKKTN